MPAPQSTPLKKKYIAAVQTGRHKLGMADDEYRALISSISNGRTESTKGLTVDELKHALAELRKDGFTPIMPDQYKKIASLWYAMHDTGIVRDKSKRAMDAYIERIAKVKPSLCGVVEFHRVIESLKIWVCRMKATESYQRLQQLLDDLEWENTVVQ